MRRVLCAACLGLALGPVGAAAMVPPTSISKSCHAVRVAGRSVSIDVISGPMTCTAARLAISRYVAGKPAGDRARSVTVGGVKLSCRSFAAGSGFAWRYVCQSPTYATAGGGRLLPAATYRRL